MWRTRPRDVCSRDSPIYDVNSLQWTSRRPDTRRRPTRSVHFPHRICCRSSDLRIYTHHSYPCNCYSVLTSDNISQDLDTAVPMSVPVASVEGRRQLRSIWSKVPELPSLNAASLSTLNDCLQHFVRLSLYATHSFKRQLKLYVFQQCRAEPYSSE